MKKLSKNFKKWNFIFDEVERKGRYAIYEKFLVDPPEVDASIGFEVIVIQKQKEHERFGQTFPAKELYPSSETWGIYGFTFYHLRDAHDKFKELSSKVMEKQS